MPYQHRQPCATKNSPCETLRRGGPNNHWRRQRSRNLKESLKQYPFFSTFHPTTKPTALSKPSHQILNNPQVKGLRWCRSRSSRNSYCTTSTSLFIVSTTVIRACSNSWLKRKVDRTTVLDDYLFWDTGGQADSNIRPVKQNLSRLILNFPAIIPRQANNQIILHTLGRWRNSPWDPLSLAKASGKVTLPCGTQPFPIPSPAKRVI